VTGEDRSLTRAREALDSLRSAAAVASYELNRACWEAGVRATAQGTGLSASTVQRWRDAVPVQAVLRDAASRRR